jgi:hypothetical protein
MSADRLAEELLARHERLKTERQVWDTLWQEVAEVVQPRKSNITTTQTPDAGRNADLYETTAVDANYVLGAGQLSYITPATERWGAFEYPEIMRSKNGGNAPDRAKKWFEECTEIAMRELARSNFYTEIHEQYLDRGGMGTGCIYVGEGKRSALNFCSYTVGSYSIAEDDEGYVDTVFREFKLTLRQAEMKFGRENFGEKMTKALEDPKQMDTKFTFVHAVFPRSERDPKKLDGPNKPIASVYICMDDKKTVRNEGYDEMPYAVSRYLVWGNEVYGYCPSIDVLPTIRQVNFIERQMDALAETKAFPRTLIPESMKGLVDLRAAGVTIFDPNNPNAVPREWMTNGEYDIGLERVRSKQEAIKKAFHNDLFQMFAQADRQMTAYEAMQRVAEKLVLFTPTFMRLTTEMLQPLLLRVFGILYRNGYFPEPPEDALVPEKDGVSLVMPQVVFTSKVALAIKALENRSFLEYISIIQPLLQLRPDTLDNFDVDEIARGIARNLSLPSKWMLPEEDRDALRDAKDKAAQAQQGMQAMGAMAKTAADMGKAPEEMQQKMMGAMNGQS